MSKSVSTPVVASPAVFVDEAVIALADAVRHLREAQKTLATQEAELRAELIGVLGNARVAVDSSGVVVYQLDEAERRNTNLALLESAFAEAYEATVSVTVYDKLNLPKK
jgi:hypothetical protein